MKVRVILFAIGLLLILLSMGGSATAADKLKFATASRVTPLFSLVPLAAADRGFWEQENLSVDWSAFEGGILMIRAFAAGAMDVGLAVPDTIISAIISGVPLVIVADLKAPMEFFIWVPGQSVMRGASDLKGTKIGISTFRSVAHIQASVFLKTVGLEKDIKFVALGGITSAMAGLKARVVDSIVLTAFAMAPLKVKGEVRSLVRLQEYLPKEWTGLIMQAQKRLVENNPDLVRRAARAILRSADFVAKNPRWAIEKMISYHNYSEEVAKFVYGEVNYGKDGKVNPNILSNVQSLYVEYGLIPKEKALPVEQLYVTGMAD